MNTLNNIIPFSVQPSGDWTQSEKAEFYRAEEALGRIGLIVETESGVSDEGEPWFTFSRPPDDTPDSGDVIAHFARIDSEYVVAWAGNVVTGKDFRKLISELVAAMVPAKVRTLYAHPSSLLIILVAALAAEHRHEPDEEHEDRQRWRDAILIAAATAIGVAETVAEGTPAIAAEHHAQDAPTQVTQAATLDPQVRADTEHAYQPPAPAQDASLDPQDVQHAAAAGPVNIDVPWIAHLQAPPDSTPPINVPHSTYALDHADLVPFAAPTQQAAVQPIQAEPFVILDNQHVLQSIPHDIAPLAVTGDHAAVTLPHITPELNSLPIQVAVHQILDLPAINDLASVALPVANTVVDAVTPTVNAVANTVENTVVPVVNTVVNDVVTPVVDQVALPMVNQVVTPVINTVVNDLVAPVIHTALNAPVINDVVAPIVNQVVNDLVAPAIHTVVNAVVAPVVNDAVAPAVNQVVIPVAAAIVDPVVAPIVHDVVPIVGSVLWNLHH